MAWHLQVDETEAKSSVRCQKCIGPAKIDAREAFEKAVRNSTFHSLQYEITTTSDIAGSGTHIRTLKVAASHSAFHFMQYEIST